MLLTHHILVLLEVLSSLTLSITSANPLSLKKNSLLKNKLEKTDHQTRKSLERRATGKVIETCKQSATLALTFDDGPYIYENQISNLLISHNVVGAFFVNGNNYRCIYDSDIVDLLKKTFQAGHLIGSHTWSHADITKISNADFKIQLDLLEVALMKILGIKPGYFRPPYGSINDEKLQILTDRGYKVVNWSFDSEDSLGATANQSKASYDKLAKEFPKPQISLNHEPVQTTADDVAPYAINLLQNAGYKLISLPECLGFGTSTESFYQSVGKPSTRDSSWNCADTPKF